MMQPRPPIRRIITRVIAFLLLGAIVNVAVAWILALNSHIDRSEHRTGAVAPNSHEMLHAIRWDKPGGCVISAMWHKATLFSHYRDDPRFEDLVPEWVPIDACNAPAWFEIELRVAVQEDVIDARGWPTFALMSWQQYRWSTAGASKIALAGLELKHWLWNGDPKSPRILPTRPIWPGFAINTLFYAAILWGLFAVPAALRRKRRIRRGLCTKCGYPVGVSDVCTECGKPVTPCAPPTPLQGRGKPADKLRAPACLVCEVDPRRF